MKRSYWQDLKGAFYLIWRNKWSFISVGILWQFVVGIGLWPCVINKSIDLWSCYTGLLIS